MRRIGLVMLTAVFVMGLSFTGCSTSGTTDAKITEIIQQNKATILKAIEAISHSGVDAAFKKWTKADPAAAAEAATALNKNITEQLLPYFGGAQLKSSAEVQEFLNSSLFKNVKDEVRTAIVAAAVVLDIYLPVPSTTDKLTQDQVDYIKAFLTGVQKATESYKEQPKSKPMWILP